MAFAGNQTLQRHRTLMVIDPQSEFLGETGWFPWVREAIRGYCQNVERIISASVAKGDQILFVQYHGLGEILPRFVRAAEGARAVATVTKSAQNLLDPRNPNIRGTHRTIRPLMGADITIIGISASACILESAASLIGHGYLCRVLADGILNHYPDQCQGPWEYREVNGLAMVMEDYARHPELLDMSGIGDCRNLMDFHRDAMKAYPH